MDTFAPIVRSHIMRQVKSANGRSTEQTFRRLVAELRPQKWASNVRALPGRPDFVFWKSKVAVFVDGCFWHGCPRCSKKPASNVAYWSSKIQRNRRRDLRTSRTLRDQGWSVYRIWECRIARWSSLPPALARRIA